MLRTIQAFTLVALAAAALQPAAAQEMRPGLWQYTVTMNMPGMPAGSVPAQTFQQCVTPKEVKDKSAYMRTDPSQKCSMSDFKQQGNQFSYVVTCKGENAMTGKVAGNATPDTINMNMDVTMTGGGGGMSIRQNMTGKRTGDCKG